MTGKKWAFIAYLAACLLVIPELFFRFVVPAARVPLGHFDTGENLYRYSPGQSGIFTFGRIAEYRTRWSINNCGWNSPVDYVQKKTVKRIAVIGDSFVESLYTDVDRSFPRLLGGMLGPEYEVYAFGMSAASLSEYLHISRYVSRYFDPDIIVFNVIYNDLIDSITEYNRYFSRAFLTVSVDGDTVTENPPSGDRGYAEFSPVKRFLRAHSALARYLIFNLKWRMFYRQFADRDFTWHKGMEFEVTGVQRTKIATAARYLIGKIKAENAGRKVVCVMDGPRECIYNGDAGCQRSRWAYDLVEGLCRENGIYFLDLSGPFRSDFAVHRRRFNTDVDAHWDEYGHKTVAGSLHDFLQKNVLDQE